VLILLTYFIDEEKPESCIAAKLAVISPEIATLQAGKWAMVPGIDTLITWEEEASTK